jgi:hypothetical protein
MSRRGRWRNRETWGHGERLWGCREGIEGNWEGATGRTGGFWSSLSDHNSFLKY